MYRIRVLEHMFLIEQTMLTLLNHEHNFESLGTICLVCPCRRQIALPRQNINSICKMREEKAADLPKHLYAHYWHSYYTCKWAISHDIKVQFGYFFLEIYWSVIFYRHIEKHNLLICIYFKLFMRAHYVLSYHLTKVPWGWLKILVLHSYGFNSRVQNNQLLLMQQH